MEFTILRVGRGEYAADGRKNDIRVDHPSVSRAHLEVFIDADRQVFVTDLSSSNGTYVNGNPIQGNYMLRSGDELVLGQSEPLNWQQWADSFRPVPQKGAVPPEMEYAEMRYTPAKKNTWLPYLIAAGIALLVLGCGFLLLFRKELFPDNDNKGLSLEQAQALSFQELQQKAAARVPVLELADSARLVTVDTVEVLLRVTDGCLTELVRQETKKEPEPAPAPDNTSSTETATTTTRPQHRPAIPTRAGGQDNSPRPTQPTSPIPAQPAARRNGNTVSISVTKGESLNAVLARARIPCPIVDKDDLRRACGLKSEMEPVKASQTIQLTCN